MDVKFVKIAEVQNVLNIMTNFVTRFKDDSAYLEIVGGVEDENEYFVEFIDENTGNIDYSNTLKINYWAQLDNIIGKNITIKVTSNNQVIFERNQNKKFNRVYILFGSLSLGDTIAWMPSLICLSGLFMWPMRNFIRRSIRENIL